MNMPMKKPEGISWNAAPIELPEMPMIQPGEDALSTTIAGVLPTLAAELSANVATLSAKENMFTGKVGVAQAAYQNSDDSGSQSVGQVVGMLGQMGQQAGQMGQMAGAPAQMAGQGSSMFGSLIQQAMQGAHGGDQSKDGQDPAGQAGAAGTPGGGAPGGAPNSAGPAGQPREDAGEPKADAHDDQSNRHEENQRHEREPLHRADDRPAAGPSAQGDGRHAAGPAPVGPAEQPRHTDDDLGRRL